MGLLASYCLATKTIVLASAMTSSYDVINMSHDAYKKVIHNCKKSSFSNLPFKSFFKKCLGGVHLPPKLLEGLTSTSFPCKQPGQHGVWVIRSIVITWAISLWFFLLLGGEISFPMNLKQVVQRVLNECEVILKLLHIQELPFFWIAKHVFEILVVTSGWSRQGNVYSWTRSCVLESIIFGEIVMIYKTVR